MSHSLFKKPLALLLVLLTAVPAFACITCDRRIREGIFNSAFIQNVGLMVLPFAVLGGMVALLTRFALKQYAGKAHTLVPLFSAALILGIGIGGFIDGIVLHQLLQWHEMISAKLPPTNYVAKSVNMFWDGIFHMVNLMVTFVGMVLLWRLLRRSDVDHSGQVFSGGLLAGWGLFNLVEGVFDHHLLKLHNVREVAPDKAVWNYGFLIFSVLLLVVGFAVARFKRTPF